MEPSAARSATCRRSCRSRVSSASSDTQQPLRHLPPTGLPIEDCITATRDALAGPGVAVIQAEPGAGKSTVIPLRLLDEEWLDDRRIVMLEPRRLAARATARRMAFLAGEEVGETIGYRTRDESRVGRNTRIEVVTDGILTRRLQRDPSLAGIGLVIFDEVHERNLQGDLALALTLDVRTGLRPDLRVLAMSATLDVTRMAAIIGGEAGPSPIVSSSGRTHPIDVRWLPRLPGTRIAEAAAAAVRTALREEEGDVLVFLAGAAEIRRVAALLRSDQFLLAHTDVRELFGGLGVDQQDLALTASPSGRRRVVLSTDLAETSLTVDGVRIVIDSGEVRRPEFNHRSGLTRLRTGTNSQASADQRAGRAGRTEPGMACRLWSQHEHAGRPRFSEPEMRTAELSALALELAVWGAPAATLPFVDPPPPRRLDDAGALLRVLGAIDDAGRPTATGRLMSELPLHPRLARMVVQSNIDDNGWLACVMAALLEERDVLRGRPSDVPIDIEERVRLVDDPDRFLASADGAAVAMVRRRAKDIARRAGVSIGGLGLGACGRTLALAFPDRIAQAVGGDVFRLRNGQRVATPAADPLGSVGLLVVADTAASTVGTSVDDRVRIAAALSPDDLELVAGADIITETQLVWDSGRDELEARVERRLGALVLASSSGRPAVGPATTAALVDRVRSHGLALLGWTHASRTLQERAVFARRLIGDPWPDLSDTALGDTLDEWLAPLLIAATRRADLERVDLVSVMRTMLGHRLVRDLDAAVPSTVKIPGGRSAAVDYDTDPPSIAVRVQEMFGPTAHPTIAAGRLPLAVHLLSPAGRVVQVTSDLPGFWAGSWSEVRKELAGRYPRHAWPVDPSQAQPSTGPRRRR